MFRKFLDTRLILRVTASEHGSSLRRAAVPPVLYRRCPPTSIAGRSSSASPASRRASRASLSTARAFSLRKMVDVVVIQNEVNEGVVQFASAGALLLVRVARREKYWAKLLWIAPDVSAARG